MLNELLNNEPLLVFALEDEAADKFDDVKPLFIGVGKVNAAYHLTKKIMHKKPDIIVNMGSAGSSKFERGSVVCCTKFVQRDMDATRIGSKLYETPFFCQDPILSNGIEVPGMPEAICGTGDNFEVNHSTTDYNVVDMEAYALAYIAQQEQIPFLCLKYISDGADDNAAEEWHVTVRKAAEALRRVLDKIRQ